MFDEGGDVENVTHWDPQENGRTSESMGERMLVPRRERDPPWLPQKKVPGGPRHPLGPEGPLRPYFHSTLLSSLFTEQLWSRVYHRCRRGTFSLPGKNTDPITQETRGPTPHPGPIPVSPYTSGVVTGDAPLQKSPWTGTEIRPHRHGGPEYAMVDVEPRSREVMDDSLSTGNYVPETPLGGGVRRQPSPATRGNLRGLDYSLRPIGHL